MSEHLFYRQTADLGYANATTYMIHGRMSEKERDIIQDSLKLYKENIGKEISCSSLINERARRLIEEIDDLIKKFDTMKWES